MAPLVPPAGQGRWKEGGGESLEGLAKGLAEQQRQRGLLRDRQAWTQRNVRQWEKTRSMALLEQLGQAVHPA